MLESVHDTDRGGRFAIGAVCLLFVHMVPGRRRLRPVTRFWSACGYVFVALIQQSQPKLAIRGSGCLSKA